MQITKDENGRVVLYGKYCPFQQESVLCGEWCALFEHEAVNSNLGHLRDVAFRVELRCAPKEISYLILKGDVVDE